MSAKSDRDKFIEMVYQITTPSDLYQMTITLRAPLSRHGGAFGARAAVLKAAHSIGPNPDVSPVIMTRYRGRQIAKVLVSTSGNRRVLLNFADIAYALWTGKEI